MSDHSTPQQDLIPLRKAEAIQPSSVLEAQWEPPLGRDSMHIEAGVFWDAVRAPGYLADRAVQELGDASGAVIRDPYVHRLTWLVPVGTARDWEPIADVDPLSAACWLEVPPADRTRGQGPYWLLRPAPGCLLTSPSVLHRALLASLAAQFGPRTEVRR